ncbi:MAG: pyridoxal phosphate-dependent aminotransferase [Lachnospiraceae bacterium]|nr:pyridoxal phosphate-dependent aminotransferase [Lachnospiraceae bacterium]
MRKYDFDAVIDRKNTSCLKWDFCLERKHRDDLLPLWVADMDFKLPEEILSDIQERVSHGIFGYTDPKQDYKDALKGWLKRRHDIEIEDDWNTVVPGVVYGIATAIRALTEVGDHILIQQPVYYPFSEMITVNKRVVVNNQLIYRDGKYSIDFDDFEKKIIENDVKMFLLCSPHNPVGRVWTKEELLKMADICLKHDVYIFSDEIHFDFIYKGHKHTSFAHLDDKYKKKLIIGTSASKSFNIAGLQVANILIPEKEVRDKFRHENDAAGYSQCNVLGMVATKAVYEKGDEWLDELLDYLEGNLSYIREFLKEKLPQVKLVEPEGTYLVWLDFSEVTSDRHVLKDIVEEKAKLWLDPGIIFGKETALFERINIACPRTTIETTMNRLYDAISAK